MVFPAQKKARHFTYRHRCFPSRNRCFPLNSRCFAFKEVQRVGLYRALQARDDRAGGSYGCLYGVGDAAARHLQEPQMVSFEYNVI